MPITETFAWDEGEERKLVSIGSEFEKERVQLRQALETKEFGLLRVAEDPGTKLLYRAFTDPHRGRQVVCGCSLADLDEEFGHIKTECALKVFTPNELYNLKPVRTDKGEDWFDGAVSLHLRNEVDTFDFDWKGFAAEKRVEVRTLADVCEDGWRTWTLQTVCFDGLPVMVVNSSGRDGDEYHNRYITAPHLFAELVVFARKFQSHPEAGDFVNAEATIPDMTEFYGSTLHDFYDVASQSPKGLGLRGLPQSAD